MPSAFSSQQTTHTLFLLLPLNSPLLLIPDTYRKKCNNVCGYFKQGDNLKKGTSQDDLLTLLQDVGLCKVNDSMLCKDKFTSMLSSYGMNNYILKLRFKQTAIITMIAIHLTMDDAGGHSAILVIETYAKILLDYFNIEIIH